jgi:uncharacterized membrane protein (UPF0127 family)
MPWLCRGDEVLGSAEVADTRRARRRGLLGCDSVEGALVLTPARAVHTLGMRFDLDVAYLDADGVVLDRHRMRRHRLGLPRWRARSVLEAQAGAFDRWHLRTGDRLEVR